MEFVEPKSGKLLEKASCAARENRRGRQIERLEKQKKAGTVEPRLDEFRWQLEELRVSLYAQELKTPFPVSHKRLDKIWNAMR